MLRILEMYVGLRRDLTDRWRKDSLRGPTLHRNHSARGAVVNVRPVVQQRHWWKRCMSSIQNLSVVLTEASF